ncbi:MAG: DegT/DnrJ/EryC1/StrS family aminotransferase [Planctomycetota bacterium]|nr:MAG: DegT/DnrJ/EryC1/StrS family aminotransferase [Planctomycetota bacterium]
MNKLALVGGSKAVTRPFPTWPIWDDEDKQAVLQVIESGKWWMFAYGETELGSEEGAAEQRSQVEQFEEEFAALHRVKHGTAVTNGSTALDICMRAIDLQAGDEVITTPYTFFASSGTILNTNALPVYVDIDPETYNIDATRIEEAITERTRAILPVYFSGELADVDAISRIAERHGLRVIEDAAQAHGVSLRDGRYAGAFGDAAIFSFQQSKCMTAGEGGIILTNSDQMAETVWSIRNYGRTKAGLWYEHHRLASNSRMSELQGALLRTQLRKLPEQNIRRTANVKYLYDQLSQIDGLTPVKLHPQGRTHNHYLVMLRYDASAWSGLPRERFLEALNAEGVPAVGGYSFTNFENPVFDKLDLSSPKSVYMIGRSKPIDYRSFVEKCPNAVRACRKEAVWLMHGLFLGDTKDVDMILEAIFKVKQYHRELL